MIRYFTKKLGSYCSDSVEASSSSFRHPWAHLDNKVKFFWSFNLSTFLVFNLSITYCGNQLFDTVRSHTVEMSEVKLQVDFVVEHVLA